MTIIINIILHTCVAVLRLWYTALLRLSQGGRARCPAEKDMPLEMMLSHEA